MSLNLIIGCMFSGKHRDSNKLPRLDKKVDETYMTIKPKVDNRYSTTRDLYLQTCYQRKCDVTLQLIPLFEKFSIFEIKIYNN